MNHKAEKSWIKDPELEQHNYSLKDAGDYYTIPVNYNLISGNIIDKCVDYSLFTVL